MLESLPTTSVLGWLTNARLMRELHGSVYLVFLVTKILLRVQKFIDVVEFEYK